MRDFPIFTTEYGCVSLILREIPYRNEAYIRILDVQPGQTAKLLDECVCFCRMAGAERVYAAGDGLDPYPKAAAVLQMRGTAWADQDKMANLFPVTEETVDLWRSTYNQAMKKVDNAGFLEKREEKRILESGGAYFIHEKGELLGIGWVEEETLLGIASVRKGAGERILHTLMSLREGQPMRLEVASTNGRAIRLYEKAGFTITNILTQWHLVSI